jgi:hypothetical protein
MALRPTTQLDLDCLTQLRSTDLPPELRQRLAELLADLLRQVVANSAVQGCGPARLGRPARLGPGRPR